MHLRSRIAVALLAGGALSTPAVAEDGFYAGIGLGIQSVASQYLNGVESEGTGPVLGLTAGYRKEMTSGFMAVEIDADFSGGNRLEFFGTDCDGGATGPYFCEQNATLRFRALAGREIRDGIEVFGSLGLGAMRGQGAVSPHGNTDTGVNSGATFGLGVQRWSEQGVLRVEVIHDRFLHTIVRPGGQYNPDYRATSLKASYILSF